MSDASFEGWVKAIFEHEPREGKPWYQEPGARHPSVQDKAETLSHLTRLFEEPQAALAPYSDAQIAAGLMYIASADNSNISWCLLDQALPWERRRRALRAIETVFVTVFEKRCARSLSNGTEKRPPLNAACFLWWDVFPTWGKPEDPKRAQEDEELLGVMTRLLRRDHLAIQESALHGLGHWHLKYRAKVKEIVDAFVKPYTAEDGLPSGGGIPRALWFYATEAARGAVQ